MPQEKIAHGVLAEIARENAVSRQSIWESIYVHGNERILQIALKKSKQRKDSELRRQQRLQSKSRVEAV